jgi:glucosyl-dolichyl phosphate glucuronosyltransferase
MHPRDGTVDLSLLVCTYNRAGDLGELLASALEQRTGGEFTYEVVVVDNNSTDGTRDVVQQVASRADGRIRYLFEERQGKSFALNTGLSDLRGWAYAIVDDDFVLPPDWLATIHAAFLAQPDVAFVSGKVLPRWEGDPPPWLTSRHWSPLALADYGDQPFIADHARPVCLLACCFRSAAVRAVGGYDVRLGVSGTRTGGTEDLDILKRLWSAGYHGLYVPELWFWHKVPRSRLSKRYHRRWHRDHGRSYAIMRDEAVERSAARVLDVPAHLFRQAAVDLGGLLRNALRGRRSEAFDHEARLWFFSGFFRTRCAEYLRFQGWG